MSEIKTASGVNVEVTGGKEVTAKEKEFDGVKEGENVTVFSLEERVKVQITYPKDFPKAKQHVKEGTIVEYHPIDAAILVAEGRGKYVK